jgi:hypothetical protein
VCEFVVRLLSEAGRAHQIKMGKSAAHRMAPAPVPRDHVEGVLGALVSAA